MPKITYIGAGSRVFARQVITDILSVEGLPDGEIALVDIDTERLEVARQLVTKVVAKSGKDWSVTASSDRCDVLEGSDFVVNSIEVSGGPNVRHDYEIPLRYGVDQCIGDTIGPGGLFKALRTGPAWLDIVADIEQIAPRAIVLNYTNPMSVLTLAALQATTLSVVGLCHSVQGSSRRLAMYLEMPYEELVWECAGINHNSWFTRLEDREGNDLYPRLLQRIDLPDVYDMDPVRFEVTKHLGAFVTESSGHFSEYVPYFRKRPDVMKQYCGEGFLGGSGFYANSWAGWQQENAARVQAMLDGSEPIPMQRSVEYASRIVEAVALDRPTVIHGNVRNASLIDNLPDGCVEVACLVDRAGIHPTHFGQLPTQLAALNAGHMSFHQLVVQALLDHDLRAAMHALMLDPLTAAVCSLDEITAMFNELWNVQRPYLGWFA